MSRVLIADNQATGRLFLERLSETLPDVTWVETCRSATEALECAQTSLPDLLLLDAHLPGPGALEVLPRLRAVPSLADVAIILITTENSPELRRKAFALGVSDFLTKPVNREEFLLRCGNLIKLRSQTQMAARNSEYMEARIAEQTNAIHLRERDTLFRLAKAGEYRDEETGGHILRMARYSRVIAEALGLGGEQCELVELAAPMHDIGKIGIRDAILLKPGRLSVEEKEELECHTSIGYHILNNSPSKYLQEGALIALAHHEKFDGSGYPGGLSGEDIPLNARIIAVADVFDALTSARPYKEPWTVDDALAELDACVGHHFDPVCMAAFRQGWSAIFQIYEALGERPRELHRQVRLL